MKDPVIQPNPKARFWQHNTFIVIAMSCNAINCGYYLLDGMSKSAGIEAAGVLILLGFMSLNLKGFFEIPKVLSILFVNLHSTSLCYVQGTRQGSYLYLFPFVMAMIFFLRVRKHNVWVTTFITGTTLNLLAIVLFFPYQSGFESVSGLVANNHLMLNIVINFLLVIIFFYVVLRLLGGKEKRNKRDIAHLKTIESELLLAKEKAEKAAAAKARFMSNMSHELRTPLNAIIGTTHLLVQDHELLQHTDHFKVLKNSSEHMLQLVNEVLDFSKLDEGKLEFIHEPFDLNDILRQATDSLTTACNSKGIRLISDLAVIPEGEHAVGDEMRLKQVILNLVSNAVKFTETGSVTLQTQIKKQVKAYREIYFAVIDTGLGIAPEKLHLI